MPTTRPVITNIDCPALTLFKKGKVRSVFDFGDALLLVSSDRVSAFDHILNEGIPGKGQVLTEVSKHWFERFESTFKHHMITTDFSQFPEETKPYEDILAGRSMLVHKTDLIEIECVVRGYLVGSGWKDYQKTGEVCGHKLPDNLQLASKLAEPIFTPAIKARDGHDENVSVDKMRDLIGSEMTNYLIQTSLDIYTTARDIAAEKGIIIADTKFEFGQKDGDIVLIDEVLTPDSSRFWPKDKYQLGISPPSYDKQIVRDHLEASGWDKNPPVPTLPAGIIQKTADSYREIADILIG